MCKGGKIIAFDVEGIPVLIYRRPIHDCVISPPGVEEMPLPDTV
jgi:hypothetical protein